MTKSHSFRFFNSLFWMRASSLIKFMSALPLLTITLLIQNTVATTIPTSKGFSTSSPLSPTKVWTPSVHSLLSSNSVISPVFVDSSDFAGLIRRLGRPRKKYGGASIADLDGDGWPDMIFGHHNDEGTDLYFNNGDGTFTRSEWSIWNDTHAITPFRFSPWRKSMHFLLSIGGSNGNRPKPPSLLQVNRDRRISNITTESGIDANTGKGRGRSVVIVNLKKDHLQWPQVIVLNAAPIENRAVGNHFLYDSYVDVDNVQDGNDIVMKMMKKEFVGDFSTSTNPFGTVMDINNDGIMELVTWHHLKFYELKSNFELLETTNSVLPEELWDLQGVVAVCEFDYNNDGFWDLYVARTNTLDLKYIDEAYPEQLPLRDILLQNDGYGRFTDVSREAGLPLYNLENVSSKSRGVTCGDFNNDGHTDVLLSQFDENDKLLLNNGDHTFTTIFTDYNSNINKQAVHGDMVTAVDYDRDGRLDVIVSNGDYFDSNYGGYYHVMKNISPNIGWFLLVRVGNAPQKSATSLHAVVTVFVQYWNEMVQMKRRVGSPGTAISNSNIELVHFGVGHAEVIDKVRVRWIDGSIEERFNVQARSLLILGEFAT